jgi:hypothetical protein
MNTIGSRLHLTTRALGVLAGLVLLAFASGLAQPSSANAARADWYAHQLDNDRCWDALQWWNGSRWLGYYWLDTNNDCTFGETYVKDDDGNGAADQFWMRRGNSGNWAALIDVNGGMVYQGENEWSYSDNQYEAFGTSWKSVGYYRSTVGPPSNPSGAYNLAIAFARQGYVYY